MTRHQSGSPTAWKLRREAYQKTQGPVSNPGDGRVRKEGRRSHARAVHRAYLADWAEALNIDVYLDAERVARIESAAVP